MKFQVVLLVSLLVVYSVIPETTAIQCYTCVNCPGSTVSTGSSEALVDCTGACGKVYTNLLGVVTIQKSCMPACVETDVAGTTTKCCSTDKCNSSTSIISRTFKKSVQTIFKDQQTDLVEMIIANNSADSGENQDDVIHYYQASNAAIYRKVIGYYRRFISNFIEMKKEKKKEIEEASLDESLKRYFNSSFSEEENVKKAKLIVNIS
ncbi:unnamed protein product, partial [Brachionus calyciflorus]